MLASVLDYFRSEEDKKILRNLEQAKNEGITSMKVIGRGTLTMDPKQLADSQSFKKALNDVSQLVENK